ncbi:MAG: protein kinase [Planctomycetes bacterium]|nr:protein kinase [Planctomycetota bacterium]
MASRPVDEAFAKYVLQTGMARAEQVDAARQAVDLDGSISLAEALIRQQVISAAQRDDVERKIEAHGPVKQLGVYTLLKKLGEGGMGAVYLGEDTRNGRKVALKVLPKKNAADVDFMKRFRREAEAAIQLDHPNIVRGLSLSEDRGFRFYAMEYCEGEPLGSRLKREKLLPIRDAVDIVLQAARGLQYAHGLGFLHRDIKPDNIFLAAGEQAKILDFGLTKNIEDMEQSFRTQTGVTMGTPHYISPEQARGEKGIDGRVDIYSLGATFYHLVTGDTPFHGSSAFEIITKHLTQQLPDPRDLRDEISDGLAHVICRMMAKHPADRYRDCTQLIAELEDVASGRPPTSPRLEAAKSVIAMRSRRAPRKPAMRPVVARSRFPAGLVVGLALLAVAGLAVTIMVGGGSEPPPLPPSAKETVAKKSVPPPSEPPRKEAPPPEAPKPAPVAIPEPKPESKPVPKVEPKLEPAPKEEPKPEPKSEPKSEPAPAAVVPKPAPPPPKEPAPAARLAVPPPAKLRDAEDKIRKARKADFDRRAKADRAVLARGLLKEGEIGGDDPIQTYALLRLAGELSIDAGDFEGLFAAAEAIQKLFDVKALDVSEKLLAQAAGAAKQPEVFATIAQGCDALSQRLVEDDLYDAAVRIADLMEKTARASTDLPLIVQAGVRKKQLLDILKAFGPVKAARTRLETKPDDATDNLQVGRFLCLYKRDFEKGIPMLAKGTDAGLKGVAELEMAKPGDAAAMAVVGDAWLALSTKAGALGAAQRDRAIFWFQKAWPTAQGKLRDRIRSAFRSLNGRAARGIRNAAIPAGWNEGSAGQISLSVQDDAYAHGGVASVRISHPLPAAANVYVSCQTDFIPAAEGEEFILSGWILSDGTRTGGLTPDSLRASFFRTKDNQIIQTIIDLPVDQPYWTYFERVVTAPAGTSSVIVSVWMASPDGTLWADDISLRRVRDRKELVENGGMERR